jgi:hypothetical protein
MVLNNHNKKFQIVWPIKIPSFIHRILNLIHRIYNLNNIQLVNSNNLPIQIRDHINNNKFKMLN